MNAIIMRRPQYHDHVIAIITFMKLGRNINNNCFVTYEDC